MTKKSVKIFLLFSLLALNSACQRWVANYFVDRPDKEFQEELKDSTVEFRQGWRDGCETGMASSNSTFYKSFYSGNTSDGWKMTSSSDYKNAWGLGFWYCYRKDWVKQKNPRVWSSIFGGYR